MNTVNPEEKKEGEVKRVEVTLKIAVKQGTEDKNPGDKIMVTPKQKERLEKNNFI